MENRPWVIGLQAGIFAGWIGALAVSFNSPSSFAVSNPSFEGRAVPSAVASHMVGFRILKQRGKAVTCSGVLLASDIAITAKHCMVDVVAAELVFGTDLDAPVRTAVVKRVVPAGHPGVDFSFVTFDGGLPKGFRPVEILPVNSTLPLGDSSIIAGYGRTATRNHDNGILRVATLTVIDNEDGFFVGLGHVNGANACEGDSGGAVFAKRKRKIYYWGTISAKPTDDRGLPCGDHTLVMDMHTDGVRQYLKELSAYSRR